MKEELRNYLEDFLASPSSLNYLPRSFEERVGSSMVEQRPFKALVESSSLSQPTPYRIVPEWNPRERSP